jgi:hypothetical protein
MAVAGLAADGAAPQPGPYQPSRTGRETSRLIRTTVRRLIPGGRDMGSSARELWRFGIKSR